MINLTGKTQTLTKLEIFENYFNVWLTIWNKYIRGDKLVYIDLFAGPGKYKVSDSIQFGSPLLILNAFKNLKNIKPGLKLYLFLVEKDPKIFQELKENIYGFLNSNSEIQDKIVLNLYNADCNEAIDSILRDIPNKAPVLLVIDPFGLEIEADSVVKLLSIKNPVDLFFTFMASGLNRVLGSVRKLKFYGEVTEYEVKSIESFSKFMNLSDISKFSPLEKDQLSLLMEYSQKFLKKLKLTVFLMPYPQRTGTIYFLIFGSRRRNITDIAHNIYENVSKKHTKQLSLPHFDSSPAIKINKSLDCVYRKSLLYQTKVEYGNWTINHIFGCSHGCKFPCYAFMLNKSWGKIKDYRDWRTPRLVCNALDLLKKEVPKFKDKIDFVHLSFMTDPFMYDYQKDDLIPDVKNLTLQIIKFLNSNKIKVTTQTKGFYPDDLLDTSKFLKNNEYGITLVSLNDDFKKLMEPYSAPYEKRISSLKKLHGAGLKTWVSIEPFPTPNIDPSAFEIEKLLNRISFVDKIIFGKLNYNVKSRMFKDSEEFYKSTAEKVIKFCSDNNIK